MTPILASALGATLARRSVRIDARMVMAFAAGIRAEHPMYFDDTRPGGVIAPAGFVATLEWPTLTSAEYLSAIGRNDVTAFDDLVHGFQDSLFHRAIRPGDQLAVSGRIVAIEETKAGALVTTHIVTADAERGDPVADGWFGALYRGTALEGAGGCIAPVPTRRSERGVSGSQTQRSSIEIPRTQPHIYTECAHIWNPIHTERTVAVAAGLPDIILHGTCTWAMVLHHLAHRHRPDMPRPLRRAAARFTGMVVPGAPVILESTAPDSHGTICFTVRDATDEIVLGHAMAVLA
jgi:acyl dehydratase